MADEKKPPVGPNPDTLKEARFVRSHTIRSLQLDMDSSIKGKYWLLLPEPYRNLKSAKIYPLPSNRKDLDRIVELMRSLPLAKIKDPSRVYMERCLKKLTDRAKGRMSAVLDIGRREDNVTQCYHNFRKGCHRKERELNRIVDEVRAVAAKEIASLDVLFSLGREGLEGQMRAHLGGEEWQGEPIKARDFRDCFRMVTQAVKGLGLPSDQKLPAQEAIMKEAADALRATREAVAEEQPQDPGETEH